MVDTDFLRKLRRSARRSYDGSALRWHLRNLRSELAYRRARPTLGGEAQRIVSALNRDGIALVRAEALVDVALCDSVADAAQALQTVRASEIRIVRSGQGAGNKGHYRLNYLGAMPEFDERSAFGRFALSPEISRIADAYFGLSAKLRYYNVWHTFPTNEPPGDSQLWHRDQEDRYILKAFLYLDDVMADSGPLSYIPGTHRKGSRTISPEAFREPGHGNLRTRDDQMEVAVPRSAWLHAVGPRGTLVFVDTGGYHKGGFSRTRERLVYTCMFTSPASEVGGLFAGDSEAR